MTMKFQPIITVGRQYGSGGRYVAKLLSERLGIPFYDKELLVEASKDSGICQEVMENYDEKQEKRGLFSMLGGYQARSEMSMYLDIPLNHRIFLAQFDTIRRIVNIYGIDPADAEESIRKADKQRASYYNYYATGTWGSVDNYHLCVDTGVMGINGAVELICKSIEIREKKIEEDKTEW